MPWGQSTFLTHTLILYPGETGHKPTSQSVWMGKRSVKVSNNQVFNDQRMRSPQTQCSTKLGSQQQSIYLLSVAKEKGQNILQPPGLFF